MLFNNRPDDLNETSVQHTTTCTSCKEWKVQYFRNKFNIQYYRNQNPILNYRTPIQQDIYLRHNELIGIANCLGHATCPRLKGR